MTRLTWIDAAVTLATLAVFAGIAWVRYRISRWMWGDDDPA